MLVQKYSKNEIGRDYIVGDIHGCFEKLQSKLDSIHFDTTKDRLFSVGDLVDRGPQSNDILEWLAKDWFIAVRGNHDQMAIDYAGGIYSTYDYARNGGAWNIANQKYQQNLIADNLKELPLAIELETSQGTIGIVHATCPEVRWNTFVSNLETIDITSFKYMHLESTVLWDRSKFDYQDDHVYPDLRALVVGHNITPEPLITGNTYYIDTGAFLAQQNFTILDAETLSVI